MAVCLERGANDLHMVQPMSLPPQFISCFIKIQIGLDLSGASLPRLSWKRGREGGVCLSMVNGLQISVFTLVSLC